MATTFLRDKLNILDSLIRNTEVELFQLELHIEVAKATTGDAQVDASLGGAAAQARAQVRACARKLEVYQSKHDLLKAELGVEQAP